MQVAVVILTYAPPPGVLAAAVGSVLATVPPATVTDGVDERAECADAPCVDAERVHVERVDVVVVDNGDAAASTVGDRAGLTVLHQPSNRGYGPGMNAGIAWALDRGADVIVLLNDDVVVHPGWLAPLVRALADDPGLGAVQPTLVYAGSDPLRVNSRGVDLDSYAAGTDRGLGELYDETLRVKEAIDVFTGGAVAFTREFLLDVGGFDERFFLYYEDVELARRGRRAGWRYAWVSESVVEHVGSASASQLGATQRYYQERNRLWAALMHGTGREIAGAFWLSLRRLRHTPRSVHARALLAGVAGAPMRLMARATDRVRRPAHAGAEG